MSARMSAARQWVGVIALALASMFSAGVATNAYAQIAFRASATAVGTSDSIPLQVPGLGPAVSAVSGSLVVPLPNSRGGFLQGDLFICVIESHDDLPATMPAGWTLLNQASGASGQHRATIFWKFATSDDTNPTVTHSSSGARIIAQIFAFRGVDVLNPFDAPNSFTGSSADLTTEADAISTVNRTLLLFIAQIGASNTATSSSSPPTGGPWQFLVGASDGDASNGVSIVGYLERPFPNVGFQPTVVYTHTNSAESHGTQIALRGSTHFPIAKPPGTQPNDVMIASIAHPIVGGMSFTPPAGWTLVRQMDNLNEVSNSLSVYVKTAGTVEPSQYVWTSLANGLIPIVGGIQSFSGVDPMTPVDVESGQNTPHSLSHSTPSITTSAANSMLVTSFSTNSQLNTWTPPAGMTEVFDLPFAGITLEGNYVLQSNVGAAGVKTATVSTIAGIGNAHILALRPASGAGGGGAAQIFYIHPDHLNTPRLITNQAAQAVWRWDQAEPFGTYPSNENPSGLGVFEFNLRFPGQYFDRETNTHYNYFRDYDPSIGRYVESDPIGLKGGLNTYAYALNRPTDESDATGLAVWQCFRSMSGVPVGNHTYFFDDKTKQCCGNPGWGRDVRNPRSKCKEGGPGKDVCVLISSNDSDSEKLLSCCDKKSNPWTYFPGINDCQNTTDDCIRSIGMAPSATPNENRFQACDSCRRTP